MTVTARFVMVLVVGWLAQAVVVPLVAVGSVQPDLVLILICAFAIFNGPVAGAVGGFFGGLLQDLLSPGNIGLGAVVKTLTGYLSGGADRPLIGHGLLIPAALIGGVSFLSQVAYLGLLFLAGERVEFFMHLRVTVLPSALYTAVIGLVLFPVLSRWLAADRSETAY